MQRNGQLFLDGQLQREDKNAYIAGNVGIFLIAVAAIIILLVLLQKGFVKAVEKAEKAREIKRQKHYERMKDKFSIK